MKKIGEIKGIPVVEGNENEVTRNQIHYKEEGGGIQLSKRGNDNKLNSVTGSSSSGDGGVKEYYYKTSSPEEVIQLHLMGGGIISGVIQYKNTDNNQGDTIEYIYGESFIKSIIAFRIPNVESRFWGTYNGDSVSNFAILNGDFYNRLSIFVGILGNPVTPEQIKEEYKDVIQEITKEEYEFLITYKPE